jgi:hypothetical protein
LSDEIREGHYFQLVAHVNTVFFVVDKVCTVGYGGSIPQAGMRQARLRRTSAVVETMAGQVGAASRGTNMALGSEPDWLPANLPTTSRQHFVAVCSLT